MAKKADPLVEQVLATLHSRKQVGDGYPLPLQQWLEAAGAPLSGSDLTSLLRERALTSRILLAVKGNLLSPVALAEDGELLAGSPLLLDFLLRITVSAERQGVSVADLKKPLERRLKSLFEAALRDRIAHGTLPPAIGCLKIKGQPHLFFWADIRPEASSQPELEGFASAFEEAFDRLDRQTGSHNFVSLVDLRKALPCSRGEFDRELQRFRQQGLVSLSATEGRHGIGDEERQAAILEEGTMLLFVSRNQTIPVIWGKQP
jgi:hypothetical protein